MPLYPTWSDIAIRLLLTVLAGALLGLNRGIQGHAAGLRTTILVGLAASISMIQANILLSVGGKTPDSFMTLDLMRFPLGILTGMGFIGGGAILKRGDLITGVTTAATLWVMTVIGLCLGGGQIGLGLSGTALAVVTVWLLKAVDIRIPRDQRAKAIITAEAAPDLPTRFHSLIEPLGYEAIFVRQSRIEHSTRVRLWFEIRWRQPTIDGPPLRLMELVGATYVLETFELAPQVNE